MKERRISNDLYGFEGYIMYSPKKRNWWYLIHYFAECDDVLNLIEYLQASWYDATIYRYLQNDIRKVLFGANYYRQIFIKKINNNG